jgi:hypothetical protein
MSTPPPPPPPPPFNFPNVECFGEFGNKTPYWTSIVSKLKTKLNRLNFEVKSKKKRYLGHFDKVGPF